MVYESDFYTTRRPYSRPTVTSYSVTDDDDDLLDYPMVQPYHRNIPYIGHKRLVIVQPSAHGWRVKQSSLLGEIDRIYHKVRPSLAYQPKEDYLNSRSITDFDDETRSIRAKTAEILKKIHTPVPRAQRPLPLPGEAIDEFLKLRHELSNIALKLIVYPTTFGSDRLYYSHTELPITERITSNNYIDRLLTSSPKSISRVTYSFLPEEEPRTYSRLGKGHLACLTYAGGRPISRRRNLANVEGYIRDDINVLSHYKRFVKAAEKGPQTVDAEVSRRAKKEEEKEDASLADEFGSIPHRPPTKSAVTGSWKSNAPRRTQSEKEPPRSTETSAGEDFDAAQERKKKRREEVEAAALKEAQEEKRRADELKRQEELAEKAAAERNEELERKARQEEEERLRREEEERKAMEEEAKRLAEEEEERRAEAKRKAKEEAARKAEEERKAREEEERRIKEEEERRAREEEERLAREEEERRLKEEEERRIKEEEERRIKEEEERKAEEERLAREEEERKAEEERLAKEKEEAEEEERRKKEEEEKAEEEPIVEEAEAEPEETNEPAAEEPEAEPVVEEPATPTIEAREEDEEEEVMEEEEEEDQ